MYKRKIKRFVASISIVGMCASLSGCSIASVNNSIQQLKGKLIGDTYTIETFDNYGNRVMKTTGDKISVTPNIVEEPIYNPDEDAWSVKESLSSAINIYVDGDIIVSCGDTCIFMGEGLEPEYHWDVSEINSESDGLGSTALVASMVNDVKTFFGQPVVVVVKSQEGFPIYAFSGKDVTWDIPDDLPKFTIINIDGKPLYIHRSNYQIISKNLLD